MRQRFPLDWRTRHRGKKRIYARYMGWLERGGYVVVALILAAFVFAFTYPMEDVITAEKAAIEPAFEISKATEATLIVSYLVEPGASVVKGQAVARVIVGEENVAAHVARMALTKANLSLADALPVVPTQEVVASSSGEAELNLDNMGRELAADGELFRVANYDDLRVTASLGGATVAQAKVGAIASLGPVVVAPANGVLVRGSVGGRSAISGDLIGPEIREEATSKLKDLHLKPRDDLELSIQEVTELLVDADLETGSGTAEGPLAEPDSNQVFAGEVISGSHSATVQLSDLPVDVAASLTTAIRDRLKGKSLRLDPQTGAVISDATKLKVVVKAKATVAENPGVTVLPATALSRTFDAQIKLQNPPVSLVELVRQARSQGRAVTTRVRVRTGQRPLAFLLLKRS